MRRARLKQFRRLYSVLCGFSRRIARYRHAFGRIGLSGFTFCLNIALLAFARVFSKRSGLALCLCCVIRLALVQHLLVCCQQFFNYALFIDSGR